MRFINTSKSFLKGAAACASMFTFCMAPVAQGAAAKNNEKQLISKYLKETGLSQKNHKITANEFYQVVRGVYPESLKSQLDDWFAENKNVSLPLVEASSFVDANNIEQVRLTLSKDGETMTVTFTGNEDYPLKVNGVTLSRSEILNPENFNQMSEKLLTRDKGLAKSFEKGRYTAAAVSKSPEDSRTLMKASLKAMPAKNLLVNSKAYGKMKQAERIEYFMRIRAMIDSAERVHEVVRAQPKTVQAPLQDNKIEFVQRLLLGENVYAAGVQRGGRCIVAGFVSSYGTNLSCGSEAPSDATSQYNRLMSGAKVQSCQSTEVPCNPLVYGLSSSGSPYCIPTTSRDAINAATKLCNQKSPLSGPGISAQQEAANKKRIVESFLNAKGKNAKINPVEKDGEFKIPPSEYANIEEYINGLRGYISEASGMCQSEDGQRTTSARYDQLEACEELAKRAFDLKTFADQMQDKMPVPVPAPGDRAGLPNCEEQIKNSVLVSSADGKGAKAAKSSKGKKEAQDPGYRCECPTGTQLNKEGTECVGGGAVAPIADKKCPNNKPPGKDGKCEKNRSWLIPLGIGVLALGALWWVTSSKKKKKDGPAYVPPVNGTDEPTAPTTPTTPTAPTPPVTSPCPAPSVWLNGACTSVVVYGGEGGTTVDNVDRGGGVRSSNGVR